MSDKNQVCRVLVCLAVTSTLAERPGSFMCCCSNMGVEWILKQGLAQKVDPREENSPSTHAGTQAPDLSITSLV